MRRMFMLFLILLLALTLVCPVAFAGGGDDDEDDKGNKCSYKLKKDSTDGFYWKVDCQINSNYCRCPQQITGSDCKKYTGSSYKGIVNRRDDTAVVEQCCDCTM